MFNFEDFQEKMNDCEDNMSLSVSEELNLQGRFEIMSNQLKKDEGVIFRTIQLKQDDIKSKFNDSTESVIADSEGNSFNKMIEENDQNEQLRIKNGKPNMKTELQRTSILKKATLGPTNREKYLDCEHKNLSIHEVEPEPNNGVTETSEESDRQENQKVQRATPTLVKHQMIFGNIPTQRQLASRLLNKIKKRAQSRRKLYLGSAKKQILTQNDIDKSKLTGKFLKGQKFDDRSRNTTKLAPRNCYWEKEPRLDPDEMCFDEIHILNHSHYDQMHYMILRQQFYLDMRKINDQDSDEDQNAGCFTPKNNKDKEEFEDEMLDTLNQIEDYIPDKYTLTQESTFYKLWRPLMVITNLITNILYPAYTIISFEQGNLEYETYEAIENTYETDDIRFYFTGLWNLMRSLNSLEVLLVICEAFFLVNMVVSFFLQANDDAKIPMREPLIIIVRRYFYGRFFIDLLVLLPMGYILVEAIDHKLRFAWALKGLRVVDLNYYISDKFWDPYIRNFYTALRNTYVKYGDKDNDLDDRLFINQEIYSLNVQNIFKLALQMLFACYFFGTYWYVLSETLMIFQSEQSGSAQSILNKYRGGHMEHYDSWVDNGNWNVLDLPLKDKLILNIYFAVTTLSTVGFGDYYPVSIWEQLIGAFFLYFGQAGFNLISAELLIVMDNISMLDRDDDVSDDLNRFYNVLKHYNNGQQIDKEFQNSMNEFFKYKSAFDKNNFLETPVDIAIFDSLSVELRNEIYTKFVYRKFLDYFKSFFWFHKSVSNNGFRQRSDAQMKLIEHDNRELAYELKTKQEIKLLGLEFPFYTFEDKDYSDFITAIFNILEVRRIDQQTVIEEELGECNEVIFVEKGQYVMGFQINKRPHYKINFREGSIIHAFNVLYECRSQYMIKASTDMECNTVKKTALKEILYQHPNFEKALKQNAIRVYNLKIHQPIQRHKRLMLKNLKKRRDLEQVIDTVDLQVDIIKCVLLSDEQDIREKKEALQNQEESLLSLQDIEVSLENMMFYAFKISQKSEHTLGNFFKKLYDCARERNLPNNQEQKFIYKTRLCIYPFSILTFENYKNTFKSLQIYEEEQTIKRLKSEVTPFNSYVKIRNFLIRADELAHPQTEREIESMMFWRKVNRKRRKNNQNAGFSMAIACDWMNQRPGDDQSEIGMGDAHIDQENRLAYDEEDWNNLEVVDYKLPSHLHDFDEVYEKEARLEYDENLDYTMQFNDNQNDESQQESSSLQCDAESFRQSELNKEPQIAEYKN